MLPVGAGGGGADGTGAGEGEGDGGGEEGAGEVGGAGAGGEGDGSGPATGGEVACELSPPPPQAISQGGAQIAASADATKLLRPKTELGPPDASGQGLGGAKGFGTRVLFISGTRVIKGDSIKF